MTGSMALYSVAFVQRQFEIWRLPQISGHEECFLVFQSSDIWGLSALVEEDFIFYFLFLAYKCFKYSMLLILMIRIFFILSSGR